MGGRQEFIGRVVSNRMQKTVVVAVDRYVYIPKYRTTQRRTSRIMAHDETQECTIGDVVRIRHSQKRSKHKSFNVQKVLKKMEQYDPAAAAALVEQQRAAANSIDRIAALTQRVDEAAARLAKVREMYGRELGITDFGELPSIAEIKRLAAERAAAAKAAAKQAGRSAGRGSSDGGGAAAAAASLPGADDVASSSGDSSSSSSSSDEGSSSSSSSGSESESGGDSEKAGPPARAVARLRGADHGHSSGAAAVPGAQRDEQEASPK